MCPMGLLRDKQFTSVSTKVPTEPKRTSTRGLNEAQRIALRKIPVKSEVSPTLDQQYWKVFGAQRDEFLTSEGWKISEKNERPEECFVTYIKFITRIRYIVYFNRDNSLTLNIRTVNERIDSIRYANYTEFHKAVKDSSFILDKDKVAKINGVRIKLQPVPKEESITLPSGRIKLPPKRVKK